MAYRANNFDYYFCDNCRVYVYDEQKGDLKHGVSPKTPVRSLSIFWKCPVCGMSAKSLRAATLFDYISRSELARIEARAKRAG